MYNMTGIENATNIYEIVNEVNSLNGVQGYFIGFVMLSLTIVMFMMFKSRFETSITLLATSFIMTVVGILFWTVGLLNQKLLAFPVLIFVISLLVNIFVKEE